MHGIITLKIAPERLRSFFYEMTRAWKICRSKGKVKTTSNCFCSPFCGVPLSSDFNKTLDFHSRKSWCLQKMEITFYETYIQC